MDDPAVRLWYLLSQVLNNPPQADRQIGEYLAALTGERSPALAMHALCGLLVSVEEEVHVEAVHGPTAVDPALAMLTPIESWLGQLDLRQRWEVAPGLDPLAVTGLALISKAFKERYPLQPVSQDQIARLHKEAEELLGEVLEAGAMEPDLRRFLVRSLQGMLRVLEHYELYGSQGLFDEIQKIVGDLSASQPKVRSEKGSKVANALISLVFSASTLLHGVGDAARDTEATVKAIEAAVDMPANIKESMERLLEVQPPKELGPGTTPALPPGDGDARAESQPAG